MMDININGDPGTGNRFENVMMEQVSSYNPAAREVKIYQTAAAPHSRLEGWFDKLQEDFRNDVRLQKKMDDIMRYRTKLPHTIGLEQKLVDGGFQQRAIDKARRQKQLYAKKATKFQYFEMANKIDNYLFAIVSDHFDREVYPLIEDQKPLREINQAVYEKVILPVWEELNTVGAADTCLCYTLDDVFGMLYYLTGNCHINWAIYDV